MARDTLRDVVDAWRKRAGLGIVDLARVLGVNRTCVYRWLDGSTRPGCENLEALAKAVGRRISEVALAIDETARRRDEVTA